MSYTVQRGGTGGGGSIHVRTYDRWLLALTLLLVGLGALMIYSSTSVITPALARKNVTEFNYLWKHLFTVLLGFAVMLAACRVSPSLLGRMSVPLLVFSFALLVLVFVPGLGVKAGGARRWLGLWPSTFQPSELVKLAMVIFLARYISMPGYRTDRFTCFIVPVAVMGLFQTVFIRQPDFGATMSLGVLTLAMLFLSGMRLRYLLYLVVLCTPVIAKLLMEPYRLKRLTSFLDPWEDAMGSGFQLVQSFIALGSGGVTGVGLGRSMQKLDFLPEVHTDFIFSMVGEELGFVLAVGVVALFALLFLRGVKIANGTDEPFAYYLAFGLSMMIGFQALVNFGVVTGMLPTKGLPLPFLSYGGSSLLMNMAAVGILLNLSRTGGRREEGRDVMADILSRKKARRAVYGAAG
jgi:cell division protein FtsW